MTFMIVKARAAFCRGCAFLLVAAAAMTASCGAFADEPNGAATPDDWKAKLFAGDERVALEEPANGAVVAIRPGVIAGYKSPEERGWDAPYNCSELKNGVKECSHPTPVAFRWTFKEGASEFSTLQLSETPDFAAPIEISAGQETSAEATNLDTGATYFWRVKLTGGENAQPVYSSARMFATASDLPRWYKVPDISNVRDLGGWNAMNGKRVKKGMLFRGTELDRNFSLTPESVPISTFAARPNGAARKITDPRSVRKSRGSIIRSDATKVSLTISRRRTSAISSSSSPTNRPIRRTFTAGAARTAPGRCAL